MKYNLVGRKNKALHTISDEVEEGEDVKDLVTAMHDICKKKGGAGLAANQIGITKRVIVINTRNHTMGIINPVITKRSPHRIKGQEGCLTYPDLFVRKKRYKAIVVEGFNQYWEPIQIKARKIDAVVLQHEIDHLNGETIGRYL